ncbi:MAG: acetyl-CoA C-acyltransferase [Sedimentibacter sp.]
MINPRDAVVVAYGRSAVCRAKNGSFVNQHPIDWTAQVLKGVLDKLPELDLKEIGDVIIGCARQENKLNKNTARLIAMRAGLPCEVSAQTINRFCASSLQAIATCSNAIKAGEEDIMIAGGVEQMSMTLTRGEDDDDLWLKDNEPGAYMSMGITAENVVEKYKVSREKMDQMAVDSHAKAYSAQQRGDFATSIIPVSVIDEEGNIKIVTEDEGIRPGTSLEKLAKLKPCFKEDGAVTAATSSQTSDGASFVVLMSAEKAESLGIKPIAKFLCYSNAGCDATMMGLGPMYAVPKVLKKSGLSADDMDIIELNEAFAAQSIPCIEELKFDKSKVNPWGGAIALGHPMGATGGFLTCKALDYLKKNNGKYALVTMCIGGGMGAAGIFELLR